MSECSLHNIYVWQKFLRKIISYWVIIWIKLKVLWLLWAFYSTLAYSGPQRQRQLMAGYFRPRLSPDNKIGHSQTTKVAFNSWIQPWKHKTTYWENWNVSKILRTEILRINFKPTSSTWWDCKNTKIEKHWNQCTITKFQT